MSTGSGKGRRRGRTLAPEEEALWRQVAGSTKPLPSSLTMRDTDTRPMPRPDLPKERERTADSLPVKPLVLGPRWNAKAIQTQLLGPEVSPVGRPQPGLDKRTAQRLRKGERAPDARVDLHGMTADRAHGVCIRFLANSISQGHRVVLVITGKGGRERDGFATGRGVLRQSLPGWLQATPLAHCIVGIYEAHQRHGGAGAFYVYLKRNR